MKWCVVGLMFLLGASLLSGGRAGPALAQSGNETATATANATAAANETISLKNFDLYLNPEYDNPLKFQAPTLLVMMQGQLVGATPPFRIKFLVPSAAGMYSAGSKDALDKYIPPGPGQPFRAPSSIPGWDEISYDLQTNIFRVEYYDPSINGLPDKTISYDFHTVYPISNLKIIVQQPRDAAGFLSRLNMPGSDPQKGVKGTDGEGFTVYTYYRNSVTPDQPPVHFDISYTRTQGQPSISPAASNTMGVILSVIVALLLIGGAAIWIMKSRAPSRSSAPRSERRRAVRQSSGGQPRQAGQVGGKTGRFCPKCGAPTTPTDKFCPSCGAKLREQG